MKNPGPIDPCASEPIHLLERVQSYGAMAVFDSASGRLLANTPNFAGLLGLGAYAQPGADRAGLTLEAVLRVATASMSARAQARWRAQAVPVDWASRVEGAWLHFFWHRSPASPPQDVLEVVAETDADDTLNGEEVLAALARFSEQILPIQSLSEAMNYASDKLLSLLGYARVLVYRFDEDMHGEVIAESWGPTASTQVALYLGLRFPASDIPPQARRLYEKNLVRIIADAADPGWTLERATPSAGAAVDLTHSLLRRPSDMHLQYMRNMGVAASVVTSLMVDGRLWGMIVCQNEVPRVPPHNTRAIALGFCEVVSSIVSSKLRWIESQAALQRRVEEAALLEELEAVLKLNLPADAQRIHLCDLLKRATRSDEALLVLEPESSALDTATRSLLTALEGAEPGRERVLVAERDIQRSPRFGAAAPDLGPWAGMAVCLHRGTPGLLLACWRHRRTERVRWGGDPSAFTNATLADGTPVLGPRRSFALWIEENHQRCEPWLPEELEFLERAGALVAKVMADNRLRAVQGEYDFVASLLPLMDDMIVAWRPAPRMASEAAVFVNDSFRRKLNLSPEDTRYSEWVPAAMQREAAQAQPGGRRPTSVATDRVELVDAAGRPIWVDCSFTLIPASANVPALVTCVLRDVTDTVEREQQLVEAKRTLESKVAERTAKLSAAMRELEGLSYSMAHDLRGPLRSINGFAALLCEELVNTHDERSLFAQKIGESSRLMGQMISDLLDLIRVVNEEPRFECVDLPAALAGLADSLTADNAALHIRIAAVPPVTGDPRLLRQLFLNLFDNAIKYRRPGVELEVCLGYDATSGRFFVRDNGSGFDRGAEGDPFQPFRRMKNAQGVTGAGIGLTVVSRIVDKLRGQVAIDSAPGAGTTVWLTLPAGQASPV